MAKSNDDGKRLEIWTKELFEELGYATAPKRDERRDGQGFYEIVYARKTRSGEYRPPMFQVDVQYWNWLGEKVICECKNYTRVRDLNLEETLIELLAKTELSGSVKGQLIIPARVASKERKERDYRGVITICDLEVLEQLDTKRRKRHPLRYLLRKRASIARQIRDVKVDADTDYRRHYYSIPGKVNSETMRRYRSHILAR